MTTGLIFIAAILILGGVIATVGDRMGMRVGKARLTLFNLRPRQTATFITIVTGGVISASTLAILFLIDDQLRTGVFELEKIQDELASAREDLQETQTEKDRIRNELATAMNEQEEAQQRLADINQSLADAVERQQRTATQLRQTQGELSRVDANFQAAQEQLQSVSQQAGVLQSDIQRLQNERSQIIAERDRAIANREAEIAERDRAIAEREAQLADLESQQTFLETEIANLEREFEGLRQGNVALLRNQPLASGVVRILDPNAATDAVDRLLAEANRYAIQAIRPDSTNLDTQVLLVTNDQVENLISQIQNGQEYVIRVYSAGNYVLDEPCVVNGEACIRVFMEAGVNRVVFLEGELISSVTIEPSTISPEDLVDQYNLLIASAQFRARQSGILADRIEVAQNQTNVVVNFFEQLRQYSGTVEIQAVSANVTYTEGPVNLELMAVQNGRVLLRTDAMAEDAMQMNP
jgi:uncharacterized protein (DUF3084 family)